MGTKNHFFFVEIQKFVLEFQFYIYSTANNSFARIKYFRIKRWFVIIITNKK